MRTKNEERRQAILRSATEVFKEAGYERASMSEIAERLSYSKATLYSYFSSKEELFYEAMIAATTVDFDKAHEALLCAEGSVREALTNFGVRIMELVYSPQVSGVRRLLIAEAGRKDSDLAARCYQVGPAKTNEILANYLAAAMDEGKLRVADVSIASLHLRGLMESEWLDRYLYGTMDDFTPIQLLSSIERAVDVFLSAYGKSKLSGGKDE